MRSVIFDNLFFGDPGNRAGLQDLRSGVSPYTLDGSNTNRYGTIGLSTLAYDDAGNLSADRNGYTYTYDYENRIVNIKDVAAKDIVTYTYDALNRRIKKLDHKTAADTRLYYYSDKWQVLNEFDGSGVFEAMYVYGNYIDEVLYMLNNTDGYYYLHDHLYSPAALIADDSTVSERYEYDAYGKATILDSNFGIRASSLHENPYLFTGRRFDTLNAGNYEVMYYRNRYYDTYMGRFLQHDPSGYRDSLNLYEYAIGNPLSYTDSLGLGVYKIGNKTLPLPKKDKGSGEHGGRPELTLRAQRTKNKIRLALNNIRYIGALPDASAHLRHYIDNSGNTLTIRLQNMVDESPDAKRHYYKELNDAMAYIEKLNKQQSLSGKTLPIIGTWTGGYNTKEQNLNWYLAIGGYYAHGKGTTVITCGSKYKMTFTYIFNDWDTGKSVKIGRFRRIHDTELQELHQAGIAQEFRAKGEMTKTIEWEKGQRFNIKTGNLESTDSTESSNSTEGSGRRSGRRR